MTSKRETKKESKGTREKADYVFEEHRDDGSIIAIGITLHFPSEAETVKAFLEKHKDDLGIKGVIKCCKKIYA